MWLAETSFACLSDYRGDKKKTAWNFKFEVYRAADQAKAGQMEEGAFAEAQVPYAKFGLRKKSVPCGQPRAAKSAATRCDAKQQRPDDKTRQNQESPACKLRRIKQINGPLITKKLFPTSTS